MELLPGLKIGWLNGWIMLGLYFVCLILAISRFSPESRLWLFNNPKDESKQTLLYIRLMGQLLMVAYIVMMIFTPLRINPLNLFVGGVIYAIGFFWVMSALHTFHITPDHQPVEKGLYRISRNPQWVGLFLVLMGSAITVGIWLYIGMIFIASLIYHIQILDEEALCKQKYGENYVAYMKHVSRYFLFF
jgi:protein-S-isoprenylcysteine O-methyltransferase Ste14